MPRPRLRLPEHDIAAAYAAGGTSIAQLAREHEVDRYVIRRILTDHGLRDATILRFPGNTPASENAPLGHVSSDQLRHAAGISYRQLDFWTRVGYLHDLPRPARASSGTPRYYPHAEVAVATLIARLLADGLTLRKAHDTARQLLNTGTATIAGLPVHLPEDL